MRAPFAAAALILLATGCATPEQRSASGFPVASASLVWPAPPDPPRIRYLGELRGESSIRARPKLGDTLRAVLAGPPARSDFATPMAVAVDAGRVYVADPGHAAGAAVHVLDLDAQTYARWTTVGGAPLQWPIDVAAVNGRVAIADARRAVVFVGAASGSAFATLGAGVLRRPSAVAIDRDGRVWVLDAALHTLFCFNGDGSVASRVGGRGGDPGLFSFPAGLALRDAAAASQPAGEPRVAVADSMNFRVQLLDAARAARAFGRKGDAAGDFSLPRDVAFDRAGHVYVLDNQFENVQIFDAQARLLLAFGEEGDGPGRFSLPSGITIDPQDRIWVADTYNRRVQVFQYIGATP